MGEEKTFEIGLEELRRLKRKEVIFDSIERTWSNGELVAKRLDGTSMVHLTHADFGRFIDSLLEEYTVHIKEEGNT